PAMEMQTNHIHMKERPQCHHFVVLPRGDGGFAHDERMENDAFTVPEDVQKTIDKLARGGNLVMLCHPVWSNTDFSDYGGLTGLFAMEVFNTGCHNESNTGMAGSRWNDMLRAGVRMWAAAVDDAHSVPQMGQGWICARARELSHAAIIESLEKGWFYASTGPEIHEFFIEDGEAVVRCSPCRSIYLRSDRIGGGRSRSAFAESGGALHEARFKLPDGARYIRIECVEDENRIAWSQPIWLDGERAGGNR
ncbi:MAG: hypothetical protein GX549_03680, partial [Clostridiales bacterium]|nr:hypothetical protein [Clostridiales bacterium]